jgi:hypothetical protein
MFKRKPFALRNPNNDRAHSEFPNFSDATTEAKGSRQGVIFYGAGFFALVWFENNIRFTRDLKRW